MISYNAVVFWIAFEFSVAATVYDSSYIFIHVKNRKSGQEDTVCGNFQQWQSKKIPRSPETAPAWRVKWWSKGEGSRQRLDICRRRPEAKLNLSGTVLPSFYRYQNKSGLCPRLAFRKQFSYQVEQVENTGTDAALFLVRRGQTYPNKGRGFHDLLFAGFKDPYLNDSQVRIFVFFTYLHRFQEKILSLGSEDADDLELRFYRPSAMAVDSAVAIIFFLGVFCIGFGGWWSGKVRKFLWEQELEATDKSKQTEPPAAMEEGGEEEVRPGNSNRSRVASETADSREPSSAPFTCCTVIVFLVVIVSMLLLLYFFYKYFVWAIIVMFTIVSAFALSDCLSSLVELCGCLSYRIPYSAFDTAQVLFGSRCPRCLQLPRTKPRLVDIIIFCGCLAFSITWCVNRKWGYAFILQDLLSMAFCIHLIKSLRLPSLKWATILLCALVVYDVFMVFISPHITKDGCSIMVEVATGGGCQPENSRSVPRPPQDREMLPIIFHVPRLSDPVLSCYDLSVDLQFPPMMLGLGDVILPGLLVGLCFGFDFVWGLRVPVYGLVSVLGYALGMCVTFLGLVLMESAQPALIYLVPITLLFVMVTALLRKEFKKLWLGNWPIKLEDEDASLNEDASIAP